MIGEESDRVCGKCGGALDKYLSDYETFIYKNQEGGYTFIYTCLDCQLQESQNQLDEETT